MPQIDPKFTFWFGIWTKLLVFIAGYSVEHAPAIVQLYAPSVQWVLGVFAQGNDIVLIGLIGLSSNKVGPLIGQPVPVPPTIVKVLIAAFAVSLVFLAGMSGAQAQTQRAFRPAATEVPAPAADQPAEKKCPLIWDPLKLCGALTGKPEEQMQQVVKRIQQMGRDDLNYAILKATAANTNSSKVRLQCLNAVLDAKNAAEGVSIKDSDGKQIPRPDPAVVTTLEDVAELVDALSPTGPLMTGCAGAAQLFKTNTLAAINGLITGSLALAAVGG